MTPDSELLRQYAEHGDEAAFAELVRRHVDLVYSAAWRQTGGNAHLAQDVAQNVFTQLARQARRLSGRAGLAGWLYLAVRYTANNLRREERRRTAREHEAYAMQQTHDAPEPNWEALQPVLDEAVCALNAADREAVLLRFFQNKNHGEVGSALGLSEDAARKRVDRALEKLRAHFTQRGVTVSSTLLAAAITTNSVQAAPATLAAKLTGGALASAATASAASIFLKVFSMTTKTKTIFVVAALLVGATLPLYLQYREIAQLRGQLAAFQRTSARSGRGSGASGALHPFTAEEIRARILAISQSPNDVQAWQAFVNSLSLADLPRVAAIVVEDFPSLQALGGRPSYLNLLLTSWAEKNPSTALDFATKNTNGNARNQAIQAAFLGWAARDPAAAAWWRQLPNGILRNLLVQSAIQLFAGSPPAVLQMLPGLKVSQQLSLTSDIFRQWAKTDPVAASAQAATMAAGLRDSALQSVAHSWAERDPVAALAWANSLPEGQSKNQALTISVEALTLANPKQAMDYASSLPSGQPHDDAVFLVATTLADNDAPEALAFLQQFPDGDYKHSAQGLIINSWSGYDPAGALAYVESLPTSDLQNAWVGLIAAAWAQGAPGEAVAALEHFPDGPGRDAFAAGLLNGTALTSPWEAEKLVPLLSSRSQSGAIYMISKGLAKIDPAAAAAWLSSLPDVVTAPASATEIVQSWAVSDPAAAGEWIKSLPAGATQDAAIQTYVGAIANSDPATAATWADAIGDPKTRNTIIEKVAQKWLAIDPQKATAWLAGASLSDDRKQKLLNQN